MSGKLDRMTGGRAWWRMFRIRWSLALYDTLILLGVHLFLLVFYTGRARSVGQIVLEMVLSMVCIYSVRFGFQINKLIWRYGGIQGYIKFIVADTVGSALYIFVERILPLDHVSLDRLIAICALNTLITLTMRMGYRYAYKFGSKYTPWGKFMNVLLRLFSGGRVESVGYNMPDESARQTINIAIVGASSVGIALAEELINTFSDYMPMCFIDVDREKVGRAVLNVPIIPEDDNVYDAIRELQVSEVVFAIPHLPEERRKALYSAYLHAGFKIKTYDYPNIQSASSNKRQLREFDIEDLLFRDTININNDITWAYYKHKVVLITGGGGSIGSELCRQIAKMKPRQIVILDIYENGVYDVQQELKLAYGAELDLRVEIASIVSKSALRRVFDAYRPDIVINAAAHKHVPLMEHNCIEAVENNVFGTQNLVELCEEFGTPRFMMVSTDKAVNPTNVMGATKRMCEMIVQSASTRGQTVYSATRFGNVLGSAGSVIPLFKRQIAGGGPVTITDKRIIRYFMTIPEAAQLVLESGAMAKNGELFVLDMGQPIRIMDLAQSMIRLSGAHGIEIVETGLRPGEKLYEELLIKTEELDKTDNQLIFVERDAPLSRAEIEEKIAILREACHTDSDDAVREALHQVVPTYKTPEEVNADAIHAVEMQKHKAVSA